MKHLHHLILAMTLLMGLSLTAQTEYRFNNKTDGFSVSEKSNTTTTIGYNVSAVTIENTDREGLEGQFITLSGIYLPNQAGAPNLPSRSAFIAIPNGAIPSIQMVSSKTKTIANVDLIPAPKPQLDNDDSNPVYEKDMAIYGRNAFYPASPYTMSEVTSVRGVEMVQVGVMPFQYNPVTKELIVYEDIELKLTTEGGNGTYGDIRYRTPEWDQILQDMLLNREVLPEVDYGEMLRKHYENRETGCQYMIITPENEEFIQLADTIKKFRTEQGVPTEVFTVTQCGGNNCQNIKNFIRNAYNTWDMPPAAVLILGDHSSDPTQGIVSYTMNNHPGGSGYNPYISDHAYSDMNNNMMSDIILGRITGRNYDEMYHMIKKDLDYERTPPTNPDFYDHPITAMGFQLERWFQLCSEIVNGFWEYELGKHPVRINAIYQGTPGSRWSTNDNTNTVINYFGPNGCGYIPRTMSHLTDWTGTGNKVNDAINNGAFILQHRDHGAEEVWGEPSYNIGYIKRLVNPDLTYVMSCNCLTGRFNYGGTSGDGCFAEAFHRHQHGALGLIAATQVSYSFVNDVFVWGMYDNMWPDFMPTYGITQHATNFLLPAFGNASGKYFLKQSNWTDDGVKEITYYLFHHHGDAYMNLYSEVPQHLDVEMLPVIYAGSDHYQLKVDEGATICLTANGQIIGFDNGTGNVQSIRITPQPVGTRVKLTIKKQNYYRYEHELATITSEEPYLIFNSIRINDEEGNGNHQADYDETCKLHLCLHNVGLENIDNVKTTLTCQHPEVQVIANEAFFGTIQNNDTALVSNAFTVRFGNALYDGEIIKMYFQMGNESLHFSDSINMIINAPKFQYNYPTLTNLDGEPIDRLMRGESALMTFDIVNAGHSTSHELTNTLILEAPFIEIAENGIVLPAIEATDTSQVTFHLNVLESAPLGNKLDYGVTAESGAHHALLEDIINIGYCLEDFEDNELNPNIQWTLGSGSKKWYITEDESAFDGHCLRTPVLAANQKAYLGIGYHSTIEGETFHFYPKTVLADGDELQLQINSKDVAVWTGENDWEKATFELKEGSNLIKFTFKKGAREGTESYVLLDQFNFPPLEDLYLFAGDEATSCPNDPFIPNSYIIHQKEILWSSEGDGEFDDPTLERPTYTFGENDRQNGTVTLNVTATKNEIQQSQQLNITVLEDLTEFKPATPSGDTLVDLRLITESICLTDENASNLTWTMEPEEAGSLQVDGNQATIQWNSAFTGVVSLHCQSSNECGDSEWSDALNIRVINSTNVDETDMDRISVYPNPTNGTIHIKANIQSSQVSIRMIDALGRMIFTKESTVEGDLLEEQINTESMHSGLYNLQITGGSHTFNTRIIVL